MKYSTLLVSFLVMNMELFSQVSFDGYVIEETSGRALSGVVVRVKNTNLETQTDSVGKFLLEFDSDPGTIVLRFSLFGYKQKEITVNDVAMTGEFSVILESHWRDLPSVDILSDVPPDTVWGDKFLNVADFAFHDDQVVLLIYESEERWKKQEEKDKTLFKNPFVVLLDQYGKEIGRVAVPDVAIQFYLGFFDEIFLECRNTMFHVIIRDSSVNIERTDPDFFREWVEPVIDTIGNLTVYSTYNPDYPAFEYMSYNRVDSTRNFLRYIVNEKVMELFRSEFKYLAPRAKLEAFRYEVKTGIDKEIAAAFMNGFQHSNYYEQVNAPVFVLNDTLMIFDHHHDQLLKMNVYGTSYDSLDIGYHKTSNPEKWSGRLVCDQEQQKVYSLSNRSGKIVLKEINLSSGEITGSFPLTYRYAEKIKVVDGWAYYIWRPFESSQARFLYKEKMN